jgi:transcriptional regulator with XRE-family HTH domain
MTRPPKDIVHFAAQIRAARKSRKLTLHAAAERIGVSLSQFANIEMARNWPSMPVYIKLCRVFGLGQPPAIPAS